MINIKYHTVRAVSKCNQ